MLWVWLPCTLGVSEHPYIATSPAWCGLLPLRPHWPYSVSCVIHYKDTKTFPASVFALCSIWKTPPTVLHQLCYLCSIFEHVSSPESVSSSPPPHSQFSAYSGTPSLSSATIPWFVYDYCLSTVVGVCSCRLCLCVPSF